MLRADRFLGCFEVSPLERQHSCEKLVSDDSEAPNIDLLVVLLSLQHFRSHVKRSAHDQLEAHIPVKLLSEAKVSDLDVEVILFGRDQENILRLHISMNHLLQMHVIEPQHELVNYVGRLTLCESRQLGEFVEELSALSQLGDDVNVVIVLDQIDDPDYVWMRLLAKNLELVLEQLNKNVRLFNQSLFDDFHGECLAAVSVLTDLDNSELATAQSFAESVPALDVFDPFELPVVGNVRDIFSSRTL